MFGETSYPVFFLSLYSVRGGIVLEIPHHRSRVPTMMATIRRREISEQQGGLCRYLGRQHAWADIHTSHRDRIYGSELRRHTRGRHTYYITEFRTVTL